MPHQGLLCENTPHLKGASLEAAFPFFVLLDAQLTVLSAGAAIKRAIPELAPGQSILTHLSPMRPKAMQSTSDWMQFEHEPLVMRGQINKAILFRGQLCPQENARVLLLLSPVVNRFEELQQLNISLSDLAHHDATGDMLMLNKIAQTSFDDAQRMAARLRKRGRQLQLMTELSGTGVAYFSPAGDLLQSNPLFGRLLDWPDMDAAPRTAEMVEQQLQAIVIPHQRSTLTLTSLALRSASHNAEQATDEVMPSLMVQTLKGAYLKLNYQTTDAQAHVLFVRDVTSETLLDRMKSEFMSTAAHELRTPMTSIYGFSELLINRDMTPEKAQRLARTINRQASWMVSLLNKLLDLARIEARQGQDFDIEPLSMNEVIDEVLSSYCDHQNLERVTIQPGQACPTFPADRIKAAQAIGNVLSNALKYSPGTGHVVLSYAPRQKNGAPGIEVEIKDNGLGMSPEQLARVFERFYRADPSCTIPGSGLGMNLVQQIMTLHGGTIELQSELGRGTQATLWFPAGDSVGTP